MSVDKIDRILNIIKNVSYALNMIAMLVLILMFDKYLWKAVD